jgi:hypothetical protein
MTLQPAPSEFPYNVYTEFDSFFYQCCQWLAHCPFKLLLIPYTVIHFEKYRNPSLGVLFMICSKKKFQPCFLIKRLFFVLFRSMRNVFHHLLASLCVSGTEMNDKITTWQDLRNTNINIQGRLSFLSRMFSSFL